MLLYIKTRCLRLEPQYFTHLLCLSDPDVRCKESARRRAEGYLGWHEQLLTEKRDPLVAMATLVLPTLCVSLFTAYLCIFNLAEQRLAVLSRKTLRSNKC